MTICTVELYDTDTREWVADGYESNRKGNAVRTAGVRADNGHIARAMRGDEVLWMSVEEDPRVLAEVGELGAEEVYDDPDAEHFLAVAAEDQDREEVLEEVYDDLDGHRYDREFDGADLQREADALLALQEEEDALVGDDTDTVIDLLVRTVIPARDIDEMTGTGSWEGHGHTPEERAARNADYAARTETGPVLMQDDGEGFTEVRSYFTWRVAARRGRLLATRLQGAVPTQVADAATGEVLWTSADDEGVQWAREHGVALKTFTQTNADTAEKAAALFPEAALLAVA